VTDLSLRPFEGFDPESLGLVASRIPEYSAIMVKPGAPMREGAAGRGRSLGTTGRGKLHVLPPSAADPEAKDLFRSMICAMGDAAD
jgi:hypothetical protein